MLISANKHQNHEKIGLEMPEFVVPVYLPQSRVMPGPARSILLNQSVDIAKHLCITPSYINGNASWRDLLEVASSS
jgi:hypothetical protein